MLEKKDKMVKQFRNATTKKYHTLLNPILIPRCFHKKHRGKN